MSFFGTIKTLSLFTLLLAGIASCKKDEAAPRKVVSTLVTGHVEHPYLNTALANTKVSVFGLKFVSANFKTRTDTIEAARIMTDGNGDFTLTFKDEIDADSFLVACPDFDRSTWKLLQLGVHNIDTLLAYNQQVVAATLTVTNNNKPPMLIIPDGRLNFPSFSVGTTSTTAKFFWKADPAIDLDLQCRYNVDSAVGSRFFRVYTFNSGPYTDTVQRTINIDGSSFTPY